MSLSRVGVIAGAFVVLLGANAQAQIWKKPIEIGMDGQLQVTTGDNSSTSLTLPVGTVRVGLQLSDKAQIEPMFSLDYVKSGSDHATAYGIGTGLVWNFSADRAKSQWYVRPFVALAGVDGSSGVSDYQTELGAGVGIRCPITSMLSWRTELNVGHWLEHDQNPAETNIGLNFGISLWSK